MLELKLTPELDTALTREARRSRKSKAALVRDAVARYLEDLEDYRDALAVKKRRERTYSVAEVKNNYDHAETLRLYFWRDSAGNQVDLVAERDNTLRAPELKAGETIAGDWLEGLERFRALTGARDTARVYAGARAQERARVAITPWRETERPVTRAGDATVVACVTGLVG